MKKISFGVLIGFILAIGFNAFAVHMEVSDNKFPIFVNGEKKDVSAYNIDGSTYLKIREVAEILGIDITFENNEIIIGENTKPIIETSNKYTPSEDIINNDMYIIQKDGIYYITLLGMAKVSGAEVLNWNEESEEIEFGRNGKEVYKIKVPLLPNESILHGTSYDIFVDEILPKIQVDVEGE